MVGALTRVELRRALGAGVRIDLDPDTLGWQIVIGARRLVLGESVDNGRIQQYSWARYARRTADPGATEPGWDVVDAGTVPADQRQQVLAIARAFAAGQ